jgi:AcrR family transcriptional regulator
MSDRPVHHGNLRAVLLDQAEVRLRERGVAGLSLRELAREAGVSHGAPRSHFIDRAALLDALAERGFVRFAEVVEQASTRRSTSYRSRLRRTAQAALDFSIGNAALLEVMFTAKVGEASEAIERAAGRLFLAVRGVIDAGVAAGAFEEADVERISLLWSATVQGAATLVASGRATRAQADAIVDDTVALVLSGSIRAL